MEKLKKDEDLDGLIKLAARLILNPNDEELRKDPLFIEKKVLVLELFEILSKPKVKKKGGLKYAFPLMKEQKEIIAHAERIARTD